MNLKKMCSVVLALLMTFACVPSRADASGTQSAVSTVQMNLTIAESITLAVTGGPVVFTYGGGTTATSATTISVTTTWNLASVNQGIYTDAYVTTPAAALTGPVNIPAADVFTSFDGHTAGGCNGPVNVMAAIPGEVAGGVCGSLLFQNAPLASAAGTHTDTITFSMAGLPVLTPGSYTGTLNIAAASNL